MAWHAIYRSADGALYSTGGGIADAATLAARGLATKAYAEPVDLAAKQWDAGELDFVDRPPSAVVLSRIDFLRLFSQGERIAIRASADAIVIDFRHLLDSAETVDLSHADTIGGLNYLETAGLIAAGRAQVILDG